MDILNRSSTGRGTSTSPSLWRLDIADLAELLDLALCDAFPLFIDSSAEVFASPSFSLRLKVFRGQEAYHVTLLFEFFCRSFWAFFLFLYESPKHYRSGGVGMRSSNFGDTEIKQVCKICIIHHVVSSWYYAFSKRTSCIILSTVFLTNAKIDVITGRVSYDSSCQGVHDSCGFDQFIHAGPQNGIDKTMFNHVSQRCFHRILTGVLIPSFFHHILPWIRPQSILPWVPWRRVS